MEIKKIMIYVLLITTTLFGADIKELLKANVKTVKFVLDSYYKYEISDYLNNSDFDSKVDVLKWTSFVKFSFIGLRNEQ